MFEDRESTGHKLGFLVVGIVITAGLLILISSLLSSNSASAQTGQASYQTDSLDFASINSANAVTAGMAEAAGALSQSLNGVATGLGRSVQSAATAASHAGMSIAGGGKLVAGGIANGVAAGVRGVASSAVFVVRLPFSLFGHIASTRVVSAAIRPADHAEVPVIDPDSPAIAAAQAALPAAQPAGKPGAPLPPEPQWPIHGAITTEFGVPEWPYQPIHTGLDISDGQRPGVTPVKPFRHGKVLQVLSSGGLGNHVIIDHGSGVTSVYGHMASVKVRAGQDADVNTVLGYEGTTGVSTGTHLHFEIRINGQATNPHQFIPGQP